MGAFLIVMFLVTFKEQIYRMISLSVYHEYEGDCDDHYTLLIGYEVGDDFETLTGLNSVVINVNHEVYKIEDNLPDAVFDKWEDIWDDESRDMAYIADFDRYNPKEDFVEIMSSINRFYYCVFHT